MINTFSQQYIDGDCARENIDKYCCYPLGKVLKKVQGMKISEKEIEKLGVKFAGLEMRTPIGVAPVYAPVGTGQHNLTPEASAEVLLKHVDAGAGYVYVVGSNYLPKEKESELKKRAKKAEITSKPYANRFLKTGPSNFGGLYYTVSPWGQTVEDYNRKFERNMKTIGALKAKRTENCPIIASISGLGAFSESFVAAARKAEESGADLVEVNVGCSLPASLENAVEYYHEKQFPLIDVGGLVGDNLDIVEQIVRDVAKTVSVPIGVKLTPETGFPRVVGLVSRLKNAGAKYVQTFNFGVAILPPDIYKHGKPRWPYLDGNPFVAVCGSWLRTICYKTVAAIAKFVPTIDIAASGGLMKPENVVEVMMLGARLAQHCTGVLLFGRELLRRDVIFLIEYMKTQGYECVEDFVGLGLQYIKPMDQVDFLPSKVVADVDPKKCSGCGRCTDSICLASYMDGLTARVRTEDCQGCGLCVAACPMGARRLIRIN